MPKSGGAVVQPGHLIKIKAERCCGYWVLSVDMRRNYCMLIGFLGLQNKAENLQEWKLEDHLHLVASPATPGWWGCSCLKLRVTNPKSLSHN